MWLWRLFRRSAADNRAADCTLTAASLKIKIAFVGLTLFGLLFGGQALASERSLTISPPLTELTVSPGQTHHSTLTVKNSGSSLISLEAFVRDFVASPAGDSPRILGEGERSSYSLSSWLLLSDKQFVLAPLEERQVKVTIAVPQNAEAGGRYGLVGFAEANTKIEKGVGLSAGVAGLYFVTVSGEIKVSASILKLNAVGLSTLAMTPINLTLSNEGNVHIRPTGFLRITNLWGRQVAELPINPYEQVVLPGSQRAFTSIWSTANSFGMYRVRAMVTLPENGSVILSEPISIWVFPIRTVGIGLLSLLIVVLIAYEVEHLRLSRRAGRERTA